MKQLIKGISNDRQPDGNLVSYWTIKCLVQPINKMHWDRAAELIVETGYPRVAPILPDLLEWLKDMNWPGAQCISQLLLMIKEPLVPWIKDALRSGDLIWNYWIIMELLYRWPTEVVASLKEELIVLALGLDGDEVHVAALRILVDRELLSKETALYLIDKKSKCFWVYFYLQAITIPYSLEIRLGH